MAITFEDRVTETLSVDEYVNYVETHVDVFDPDSICASAPQLAALMNNETLITDMLNRELSAWEKAQQGNFYSSQSYILGRGKGFFVRANVWLPKKDLQNLPVWRSFAFAYDLPHDHNFDFLTGGYHGPGYETDMYEYDRQSLVGIPGERANLRFLERTSLPKGKMMFYQRSKDVHCQRDPSEISVSINLMVPPPNIWDDQFVFDLERDCVSSFVTTMGALSEVLCTISATLGNSETAARLAAVAKTCQNPRIRRASMEALEKLEPAASTEIIRGALEDSHPLVRDYARERACAIGI